MEQTGVFFEYSPFLIFFCIGLGFLYAWLLYQKNGPWSARTKKLLFALRLSLITLLSALLISPNIKQIKNTIEKPTLVLAIDNSKSIIEVMNDDARQALLNNIEALKKEAETNDYVVEIRDFNQQIDLEAIDFNQEQTNLMSMLQSIKADYEGRNLAKVVLVSDGIYNVGISPNFGEYNFEIHTVGFGDTIPKRDISIIGLKYNRLSYEGNKFPLIVALQQQGFDNEEVTVTVYNNSQRVAQQNITLPAKGTVAETEFLLDAKTSGFQRYQVRVQQLPEELTYDNNIKNAFIEIIDGKEQIAILAAAPHPDIKALKSAIESNANYEVSQFLLSDPKELNQLRNNQEVFDLVIYHQLPDRRRIALPFLQQFESKGLASFFIYGEGTDLNTLNAINGILKINISPSQEDKVLAIFNQDFKAFSLSDDLLAAFDQFPPLSVPFGKYNLQENAEALLYQKVGAITTDKPLLAIKTGSEAKRALWMGQGLWKWKLADYANNGDNRNFNELITKLIQYLSTKEDKRTFRVFTTKTEFLNSEAAVFETEVYNDLYERIYGNEIALALIDENGEKRNYNYTITESNSQFTINGLPQGVYKFTATTTLKGAKEIAEGEFVVRQLELESINLTADFNLLRRLSEKTGGEFYLPNEFDALKTNITSQEAKGIIHTSEAFLPFINLVWILILLLIIVSGEWFLRKYNGSY